VVLAAVLTGCAPPAATTSSALSAAPSSVAASTLAPSLEVTTMPTTAFTLTSDAFANGEAIPREYSCQGDDVSPALTWSGVPAGAAALVLVVDDPTAGNFTHWIVLDIAAHDGGLPKAVAPDDPPQQGTNDFGRVGWGGPCPPSGTHDYRFQLYALAAPLGLSGHPRAAAVRDALGKAQVLGQAVLTGTYRRS
jgi:Raf kinase inhibitor-like YbhB/YbcL family protein